MESEACGRKNQRKEMLWKRKGWEEGEKDGKAPKGRRIVFTLKPSVFILLLDSAMQAAAEDAGAGIRVRHLIETLRESNAASGAPH